MKSILFLSFDEPNANANWLNVKGRFPQAKRVHGVSGILAAHQACAEESDTEHFFLIDGDNEILPDFKFHFEVNEKEQDAVHVWRCKNPVNDLAYGYGAIKLYSKSLLLKASANVDLATSAARKYKIVPQLASVTHFNTTPFSAWRGAFRECVKLSSGAIVGQIREESRQRLDSWCTLGEDRLNGRWCIAGALAGKNFGAHHFEDKNALTQINDFHWLKSRFENNEVENERI